MDALIVAGYNLAGYSLGRVANQSEGDLCPMDEDVCNGAEKHAKFDEASRQRRAAKQAAAQPRRQREAMARHAVESNARAIQDQWIRIEDLWVRLRVKQYFEEGWTLDEVGPDWATMHKRKGIDPHIGLGRMIYEAATANQIQRIKISAGGTVTRIDQDGRSYR